LAYSWRPASPSASWLSSARRRLGAGGEGLPARCFFFYGSILLVFEARLALSTTQNAEMISSGASRAESCPKSWRTTQDALRAFQKETDE